MPILDIEAVIEAEEALRPGIARELADAAGLVLGSEPGQCWVKLRLLPLEQYSENGDEAGTPVFVSVLLSLDGTRAERSATAKKLSEAIGKVFDRPADEVHVLFEAGANGRVAFGGELFVDKTAAPAPEVRAPSPRPAAGPLPSGEGNPKNLFVGGIPYEVTEQELEAAFAAVGPVAKCRLLSDRETGRSKGLAFVEMATEDAARTAIAKLNGSSLKGRKIFVSQARPPEKGDFKKGPRTFGPKKFGDRTFGPKKFGDRKFGPKKFGPKKEWAPRPKLADRWKGGRELRSLDNDSDRPPARKFQPAPRRPPRKKD